MAKNRKFCMIALGIALLFFIYISLYMAYLGAKTAMLKSEMNEKFSMKEDLSLDKNAQLKTCDYTEESFAYPVMSPNIPVDPKIMTYIGYNLNKCNKGIKGGITGEDNSLVKLVKPLLKYDGIYRSDVSGTKEVETQKWKMNLNPMSAEGTYGSDKLLPPKNFPF